MKKEICQSCGMKMTQETKGTNPDQSKQDEYCYFCYKNGEFINPSLTLEEQTEKLIQMAVKQFNIPKDKAIEQTNAVLPNLKRWRK